MMEYKIDPNQPVISYRCRFGYNEIQPTIRDTNFQLNNKTMPSSNAQQFMHMESELQYQLVIVMEVCTEFITSYDKDAFCQI